MQKAKRVTSSKKVAIHTEKPVNSQANQSNAETKPKRVRISKAKLIAIMETAWRADHNRFGILNPTSVRQYVPYTGLVMQRKYHAPWKKLYRRYWKMLKKAMPFSCRYQCKTNKTELDFLDTGADERRKEGFIAVPYPSIEEWLKISSKWNWFEGSTNVETMTHIYKMLEKAAKRYLAELLPRGYGIEHLFWIAVSAFYGGYVKHGSSTSEKSPLDYALSRAWYEIRMLLVFEKHPHQTKTENPSNEKRKNTRKKEVRKVEYQINCDETPDDRGVREYQLVLMKEACSSKLKGKKKAFFEAVVDEVANSHCKPSTAKSRAIRKLKLARSTAFLQWNEIVKDLRQAA